MNSNSEVWRIDVEKAGTAKSPLIRLVIDNRAMYLSLDEAWSLSHRIRNAVTLQERPTPPLPERA